MRVLEWVFPYAPIRGGRAVLVERLATRLSENSHDVLLIGSDEGLIDPKRSNSFQFEQILFPFPDEKKLTLDKNFLPRRKAFIQEILAFNPEIIHFHNTNHASTVYLFDALDKVESAKKVICSLHDLESVEALNAYSTQILDKIDFFICPSEFIQRELLKLQIISKSKIQLILLGVPLNTTPSEPTHTILGNCVASSYLAPHKGVAILIAAWVKISQQFPSAKLTILGDGPEKHFLEEFTSLLRISNSVTFRGWVTYEEVVEIMSNSSVCFVPSIVPEAFGMTAAEAQMSGVPVVASSLGGLLEIIDDDVTGYLVAPGDISVIVKAAELILGNPFKYKQMSTSARVRAQTFFDIEKAVSQYIQLFESE